MAGAGNGDKSGGGPSTPVIVALITVSGVMFTALLGNWDKIFGSKAAPASPPAVVSQNSASNSIVPVRKDAAQQLSDSQKQAYGAAAGALDDVTRQIEVANTPNITGVWADADGYSFHIRQSGSSLTYQEYANGARVGEGAGQINGRDLRYSYQTSEDSGECLGQLSTDGNQISGRCKSVEGNAWPFTVVRQD